MSPLAMKVCSVLPTTLSYSYCLVDDYKSKVGSAMAEVDDILGGFELPGDQYVPSYGESYSCHGSS